MTDSLAGGAAASPLSMRAASTCASAAVRAARQVLTDLERGRRIDAAVLRNAMQAAFGGSDAEGAWNWKIAYDVCEAATVLFLRKFGPAMRGRAGSTAAMLPMLARLANLLPTHTRRSEDSQRLQQFSTPIPLGLAACAAADITTADTVLEPSAGTGLLAVFAELAGGALALNELGEGRAALLDQLFPGAEVTRFDAAQIDDHLDVRVAPSVVLMNPPFSAFANVDRRMADAALRHIASALARLREGGRLVAITGDNLSPEDPRWTDAFVRLQARGRVVFSAALDGAVYARHGTQVDTRLLVIDKLPALDAEAFPVSPGTANDVATLLEWVGRHVLPRLPVAAPAVAAPAVATTAVAEAIRRPKARPTAASVRSSSSNPGEVAPADTELTYECQLVANGRRSTNRGALRGVRVAIDPYPWGIPAPDKARAVRGDGIRCATEPSYRPHLSAGLVTNGLLSDAQLESIIYAGEAHSAFLAGSWTVDATFDVVAAARDDTDNAVRFRRGWFLGDGTGAGKGRQVAGILLDNWLKERRRAPWSASPTS